MVINDPKGAAPKSQYTGIPGWHDDIEERQLISLAQQFGKKHVVEIGGEYGRSAGAFFYALQDRADVNIWTIDKFPTDHHAVGDLRAAWRHNVHALRAVFGKKPHDPPFSNTIKGISWDSVEDWQTESGARIIDLLFIDGDHTYAGVKKDIEAWTPLANVVVFHDYAKKPDAHALHHEVKRAADELMTADIWSRTNGVESLVWFERKVPLTDDPPKKPTPKPAPKKPTPKKTPAKKATAKHKPSSKADIG